MKRPGRAKIEVALLLLFPTGFLVIFFVLPLLNSAGVSLELPNATVASYRRLMEVPVYGRVYLNTLRIATVTTLICLILGYPCAYYIASLPKRQRTIVVALIALPFMLSVLVRNYVWMTLLQDTGLINRTLLRAGWISSPIPLMHNEVGVLIAMSNMLVPYIIFPVLSALLAIPRDLELASASLGADRLRGFLTVTLPLTATGTAAGCLLTFIVALGFYITPAMLGGPREMMLSNLIAFNIRDVLNWPLAFALSTTLLASTIALYFVYRALLPSATVIRPL